MAILNDQLQVQTYNLNSKVDILLVDDRPENLLVLEAVLDDPRYQLHKAESGEEALRYLLENIPALILLDVQMPKINGFEAAAIIKKSERTKYIPIIFITAINKDQHFVIKGHEMGAVDYILKPFETYILRSKVSVFVELHLKNQKIIQQEKMLREKAITEYEHQLATLKLRSLQRQNFEQQRYLDLVEGINQGIVWSLCPKTMVFSFIGPSVLNILGISAESFTLQYDLWVNHLHPLDRELFSQAILRAKQIEESVEFEHRMITADQKEIWLLTRIKKGSVENEEGRFELRGLSVDISKLKQTESALITRQEQISFLAQAGLLISESLDLDETLRKIVGLIVPQLADCLVVSLVDEIGLIKLITIGHVDPELALKYREQLPVVFDESNCQIELSNVIKSGKAIFHSQINGPQIIQLIHSDELSFNNLCSMMIIPLKVRGKTIGAFSFLSSDSQRQFGQENFTVAEDLCRRAAVAIDNARLYKKAQEAIGARDDFLSVASHELRTPLTSVKLQTQLLAKGFTSTEVFTDLREKFMRMIQVSDRQLGRMAKLIDNLLDISLINNGQLKLKRESFDIRELIQDVLDRYQNHLTMANCSIELSIPRPIFGTWDRSRMEQVLTNLLSNAMKYGEGRPIHISAQNRKNYLFLTCQDEGIGIAKEDQIKIFQRFERVHGSGLTAGLGLGLYIVAQIVEAHGGKIWVDGNTGKGSIFNIRVPLNGQQLNQQTG